MDGLEYLCANGLDKLIDFRSPQIQSLTGTVDGSIVTPFPAGNKTDDLARLHRLCRERRVTTILEFGVGYSTQIFAHALSLNSTEHGDFVKNHLRRGNPFEVHSVDDLPQYVEAVSARLTPELQSLVHFHVSPVQMTTFADRICTEYVALPNICPDLIYIDGPSMRNVIGSVGGITTDHVDRLPMMCDVLRMEHFLLPGTLIVVDGRAANARFLKTNFQRRWAYYYDKTEEVHFFEMQEEPLGRFNKTQLEYCLHGGFMIDPVQGLRWY